MIGAACVVVAVGVALVLKRRRTSPSSSVAVAKPGPRGPAAALGGAPQAAAVTVSATSGSHGPALTDGTSARKKGKGASGRRPQVGILVSVCHMPRRNAGVLWSRFELVSLVFASDDFASLHRLALQPLHWVHLLQSTAPWRHVLFSTAASTSLAPPLGTKTLGLPLAAQAQRSVSLLPHRIWTPRPGLQVAVHSRW
jgi:hypothetical protein